MNNPEFRRNKHPEYAKRVGNLMDLGFRFVEADEWMSLKLPMGGDSTYMVNDKGDIKEIGHYTGVVSDYNVKPTSSKKTGPRP